MFFAFQSKASIFSVKLSTCFKAFTKGISLSHFQAAAVLTADKHF